MKSIFAILFIISSFACRASDESSLVDFALAGEPSGSVRITEIDGSRGFIISDTSAQLQGLKVNPATKYTLTLDSSFEGEAESIEENPRFEFYNQPGHPNSKLPSHEIRFFNASGAPVGLPLLYMHTFRNRRTYRNIFYTPSDATVARIKLTSGKGIQLTASQLKLFETPDEKALNPNPAFQLGLTNYSGWKNIADGGELIERHGKVMLDTKYGSTGQPIPLFEPGTHAFSARATPNGYNSTVIVRVYDAAGKELMRSGTRKYGPLNYFVPPREAVSASFLVYSCLLEEVRFFRVGDENAITELRAQ